MKNNKKIKAAILGVTGYTGVELYRILLNHPLVHIVFASSESHQGRRLSDIHPQFSGLTSLVCSPLDADAIPSDTDMVFCALPHGKSVDVVPSLLKKGFRVIDLSADFRLKKPELYSLWYERVHAHPNLLQKSVYGLPEIWKKDIKGANLLANPGCYPTSILLALAPLAKEGLLDPSGLIIDSTSGVSGAGRSPKQPFHFPECGESFKAYRVATHQHTPEIEQELGRFKRRTSNGDTDANLISGDTEQACNGRECGSKGKNTNNSEDDFAITFTPHLVPMNRGILSTVYTTLYEDINEEELLEKYRSFYRDEPFVAILEPPLLPETRWVRGSNFCHISLRKDLRTGRVIILSAIDNLVKGAAGQAVQNMNIMCGCPEDTGLRMAALVP